mgnify:CR=1 FL=1
MEHQPSKAPPIPVTVIGGYLGAGKTTLVNALLREAEGVRLAVLVNDFGELPIDADLIESRNGNVIGIAGGCVCCSYGSDLVAALIGLARANPRPDHVLLETSGVALPGQVAASLTLMADYAIDAIVTLVDAAQVRALAQDRYLADTIARQVMDAHIVVLNKIDLVPDEVVAPLERWVKDLAPGAHVLPARNASIPMSVLTGREPAAARARPGRGHQHHGQDAYATRVFLLGEIDDAQHLLRRLAEPENGLLRAKGILKTRDGRGWILHIAGAQATVTAAHAQQSPRGLVVIGRRGVIDLDRISGIVEPASRG